MGGEVGGTSMRRIGGNCAVASKTWCWKVNMDRVDVNGEALVGGSSLESEGGGGEVTTGLVVGTEGSTEGD